jgi:uncharacterized lipoprotein YmbA
LDRVPPVAPVARAAGLPIGINSVELPPGFDRKEIVVRQSNQQLDVRSTDQWPDSLAPLVLHTLAYDLADRLPVGLVVLPGEAKPIAAMRSIDVGFEDLAAGPDAKVTLDAHWVVHEAGRADVTHHDRLDVPLSSLDSVSVASGMSQAVATLADRIATTLAPPAPAR